MAGPAPAAAGSKRSAPCVEDAVVGWEGYMWLKYGEKRLSRKGKLRSYFKCSRSKDLGCAAKKWVDSEGSTCNEAAGEVMLLGSHTHADCSASPKVQDPFQTQTGIECYKTSRGRERDGALAGTSQESALMKLLAEVSGNSVDQKDAQQFLPLERTPSEHLDLALKGLFEILEASVTSEGQQPRGQGLPIEKHSLEAEASALARHALTHALEDVSSSTSSSRPTRFFPCQDVGTDPSHPLGQKETLWQSPELLKLIPRFASCASDPDSVAATGGNFEKTADWQQYMGSVSQQQAMLSMCHMDSTNYFPSFPGSGLLPLLQPLQVVFNCNHGISEGVISQHTSYDRSAASELANQQWPADLVEEFLPSENMQPEPRVAVQHRWPHSFHCAAGLDCNTLGKYKRTQSTSGMIDGVSMSNHQGIQRKWDWDPLTEVLEGAKGKHRCPGAIF